ncbi:MAG: YggS family pyridoxal phosphate-dependent enzyme [Phycisphaeraceae bacterium]|nr:MAG: YggS family pyridoxal phosphate-dependent enzyme [Phycisphaeraceae bacterium]
MSTVSLPDSLAERYAKVCDRIARSAEASGRKERDIFLVAVTKNAEPDQVRAMIEMGHRDFGENRVQQLVQRAAMVDEYLTRLRVVPSARRAAGSDQAESLFGPGGGNDRLAVAGATGKIRWHMIGHLQRNKARKVVDLVRLVHSVDSLRVAEELQAVALRRDIIVEVLLQVNCSGEGTKFGCPVPAAVPMAEQIQSMANVRLRGLMTIAAEGASELETRRTFARCREIHDEVKALDAEGQVNLLSMGMTGDYHLAILEGANIVRVGTALFGESRRPEAQDEPEEPDDEPGEGE